MIELGTKACRIFFWPKRNFYESNNYYLLAAICIRVRGKKIPKYILHKVHEVNETCLM